MSRLINPWIQFLDESGNPYAGGTVYFGLPNQDPVSNPKPPYSDSSLSTPIGSSQELDSKGMLSTAVFLNGAYSLSLFDVENSFVRTEPEIRGALTTDDGAVLRFSVLADAVSSIDINEGDALNIEERTTGNGGGAMWDVVLSSTVTENTYNIVQCTGVPTLSLVLRIGNFIDGNAWGAVGDGALTGAAQEGTGTGTDDSAAIQHQWDHIRDNGGEWRLDGSKVYRCDSVLTLLRNSNTGPTNYNLQFNGAALDFSNLASGDYLKVGADSLANIATDVGQITLSEGRIFGQQTGNPGAGTPATNTDTRGIHLQFAYNVKLDHMIGHRCYIGLKTTYVFPLTDIQSSFKRCIVGVWVNDVTNDSTWIRTEAAQCRFGMIAQPDGVFDTGKCINNQFHGFRAEGVEVGVALDPGTGGVGQAILRDWSFFNSYFASPTYDVIRAGTSVDPATSSARGTDRSDRIYGLNVYHGIWNYTPSATSAAFAFSSNQNVRAVDIKAAIDDTTQTVVNSPRLGSIEFYNRPDSTSDFYRVRKFNPVGSWTETEKTFTTFTTGDMTPSIQFGENFKTNNGGATTITNFGGGEIGQTIFVIIGDGNTTIDFTGSVLKGNAGADWSPNEDDHMICKYDGTNWFCDVSDNTA